MEGFSFLSMSAGLAAKHCPTTHTLQPTICVSLCHSLCHSQQDGADFEIVFVSMDRSLAQFQVGGWDGRVWLPPFWPLEPVLHVHSDEDRFAGLQRPRPNQPANARHHQDYFQGMPWLAVPYTDDQLRSVLSRKFNVRVVWGALGGPGEEVLPALLVVHAWVWRLLPSTAHTCHSFGGCSHRRVPPPPLPPPLRCTQHNNNRPGHCRCKAFLRS